MGFKRKIIATATVFVLGLSAFGIANAATPSGNQHNMVSPVHNQSGNISVPNSSKTGSAPDSTNMMSTFGSVSATVTITPVPSAQDNSTQTSVTDTVYRMHHNLPNNIHKQISNAYMPSTQVMKPHQMINAAGSMANNDHSIGISPQVSNTDKDADDKSNGVGRHMVNQHGMM